MSVKLAIIYYSATATTYELARTMEEAAQAAGADVRLRKVPELAPEAAINSNPAWAEHVANSHNISEASLADLEWADAIVFGAPTRFGLPAAQLKQFIDTTGGLWAKGALVNKVVSSFTSAATHHGGQESTILALNNTFYHWGCIIVPPAYADPVQFASGTPYGTSFTSNNGELSPDETARNAARFQVTRLLEVAAKLVD
jgi:NAD(P)H dehydrogenase (quinone)